MIQKINAKAVVDVIGQCLHKNYSILIEDDTITWVGPKNECPPGVFIDTEYDLKDEYILPGLINCHLHLGIKPKALTSDEFFKSFSEDPPELLSIYAAVNAKKELLSGVTTVRDCGAPGNIIEQLRIAQGSAPITGPHLIHCGPIITAPGGHGYTMGAEASGKEALKDLIYKLAGTGIDFIKIAATGGGTPGTHPHLSTFKRSELHTIITTAHGMGLKVAAHARGIDGVKDVINAGVDSIEHCDFESADGSLSVCPELLDVMAEKSICLVPTIQLYQDLIDRASADNTPQGHIDLLKASVEQKLLALETSVKAGVPIMAGNDGGLPDTKFGEFWKELVIMSKGGMSNMMVIQSATSEAAKLISRHNKTGSITVGKIADIIAVKSNPVEQIKSLQDVCFVMKAGTVYKAD